MLSKSSNFTGIFPFHLATKAFLRSFASVNTASLPAYSHIIVGAGSAGCVLANRLSANPKNTVLLLEAGKSDLDYNFWKIHMPAALTYNLMNNNYNWYYHTEPQANMLGRKLYHPRGKVLGGSSSLNAMVYIRGHAFDYDRWAKKESCDGWAYADCLPYFKRSETFDGGANPYRGDSGPIKITTGRCDNPLHHVFMQAGQEAGYPVTDDINGYQQEGFGFLQMTIGDGIRCSTARGYLHPALKLRKNLHVRTRANVARLLLEGDQTVGVEMQPTASLFSASTATPERIFCDTANGGMVIVCGGAFNSPHVLMLSGIGPAAHLRQHDIPVHCDLPGVGQNLQDHLEFYAQWRCKKPITLLNEMKPLRMLRVGMEWFMFQTGSGSSSHLESGAFTKTSIMKDHPDIQWHFLPGLVEDHGRSAANFHAFQVHIGTMRPTSRGYVALRSKNPADLPIVQPNYFSTAEDLQEMRVCLQQAREVINQPAFDAYRGDELKPGSKISTDEEIDEFLRQACESAYHPSCTLKMGPKSDPMAVVDPQTMNVWGFRNLKVVDASVMPSVVSGNLNGPTIMLAEKAADILLQNSPLPPASTVPVYEQDKSS